LSDDDADDDDNDEEYNNIDVDSEDDEGALQRAIFLSLERDNPGRVGRGLRNRPKGNDDERDTYEDMKKAADEAKILSEEKKEDEEAAEKASREKAEGKKKEKQKMVTFLEEEGEEVVEEEKILQKPSSAPPPPPPPPPTSYQPSSFQTDTPENEFFKISASNRTWKMKSNEKWRKMTTYLRTLQRRWKTTSEGKKSTP
jgi:hypothetical protein